MSDSFQDVYAKYLQHHDYGIYGYPLRMPEPMSTLPENYQDFGLQIGDVGVVDREGQFNVLFNICKRDDNAVNVHGVPDNFQPVEQAAVKSNDKAIRSDAIYSHGIKRNVESANDYEFESSAPAGAILILPQPVTSTTLISLGEFREVATQQALNWYEFAKKFYNDRHLDRSLYLITGFYKTTSWSLASFKRPTSDQGRILARKGASDSNEYQLKSTFPIDCRSHSGDNINQTVFITGFTISVKSWLPGPVVLQLPGSETLWSILVCLFKAWLNRFRGSSHGHKQPTAMIVEDNPTLSQPFHPSDIINGFLLSKNPSAKVAITHDDQWMEMMKEGLTHEDFLQTDHLRAYLDGYNVDSERENAVVFLRSKTCALFHIRFLGGH
ncbi:hypothetical protein EV401DRAFT_696527 [Pisolithus croceorrhizus]|nr:hypothetical protein EV401DRAFT_696527 [Pisolithus croceorrhizus]